MKVIFTFNITADHDRIYDTMLELNFKIRHVRNKQGPPYGGLTFIHYTFRGESHLLASRCHPNDKFCKTSGVMCCLQKWVDINYPGLTIVGFTVPNQENKDTYHAHVSDMPMEKYWWTK